MRSILLLCVLSTSFVFAINIQTTVADVVVGRDFQRAGSMTISITDDIFSGASESNPLYMPFEFDHFVKLSETLVDLTDETGPAAPINLAAQTPTASINMPADAISIVRWRKGESRIWLKITAGSSTWIDLNGTLQAPSDAHPIILKWWIGPEESQADDAFGQGRSNLVANTQSGEPASTALFLNLTESTLQSSGIESILSVEQPHIFEMSAGVESETDPSQINIGNDTSISLGEMYPIGRGTISVPTLSEFALIFMCLTLMVIAIYKRKPREA